MLRSAAKIFRAISFGSVAAVRGYEADIFAKVALNKGLATEDFHPLGLAAGVAGGAALIAHALDKAADSADQAAKAKEAQEEADLEAQKKLQAQEPVSTADEEETAGETMADRALREASSPDPDARASEGDLLKKDDCCDSKTVFVLLGAARSATLTVATWAVAEGAAPVVFSGALLGGAAYITAEFVTKKCKGEKYGWVEAGKSASDFATNNLAFICLLKGGKVGGEFLEAAKTRTLDVTYRALSGATALAASVSGLFYAGKAGKELVALKEECKKDPEAYRRAPG